jgi:hypothetical protein
VFLRKSRDDLVDRLRVALSLWNHFREKRFAYLSGDEQEEHTMEGLRGFHELADVIRVADYQTGCFHREDASYDFPARRVRRR